ncbi:hypothetical protein [Parasitella parasitica]|uniref:Uncharacterized protein n=1 Tax=Parasitella parasitica TaxID=35722 RepID=A0A0B7MQ17_9FUNG|nr:hypothetical protein [Parasitella parasitica]
MMASGEIKGLTAEDIPNSGSWMGKRVSTLKQKGYLSVEESIRQFEALHDNGSESESEPEHQSANKYAEVVDAFTELQSTWDRAMGGLAKAMNKYVKLVVSGEIEEIMTPKMAICYVNFEKIDLDNRGIGKDAKT